MTDRWLQALKPAKERREFADSICPGLRLRIGPRTITWSVLLRGPYGRKRIGLGRYPEISLLDARRLADGADTQAREMAETKGANYSPNGTLRDLFNFVIEQMRTEGAATVSQYEAYLINRPDSALNVIGIDKGVRMFSPTRSLQTM